ncbi:MAG TPA: hypothetical protein VK178_11760, partial [Opitutaceae bacterium]|nr:hypothetical protein [Opitutaceae bacterium]
MNGDPLKPRLRQSLLLLWMMLALAACSVAVVFHRLYSTARDEIAAQSAAAVAQEKARAVALISAYADEVRRATVAELAGFHVDGLKHTLRRWDEANELVLGTFVWDPKDGIAGLSFPDGALPAAELQRWLTELREWRAAHLDDPAAPRAGGATHRSAVY